MLNVGHLAAGLVLGLGATGSAAGIGVAGMAAIGAWAAEARAGLKFSFQYMFMVAAPISLTLYAMILMDKILDTADDPARSMLALGVGVGVGLCEAASAYFMGLIGAASIRFLQESKGKGFGLLIITIGVIETVGIFGMVFGFVVLKHHS